MENKWIEQVYIREIGQDSLYGRQHVHDDGCEILWVVQGNGNILLGDTLYRLESSRLYFIPPLMLHYTHPSVPENYIRSKLVFSRHSVRNILTACGSLHLLENLEQTSWSAECREPEKIARIENFFEEASKIIKNPLHTNDARSAGLILQMISYFSDTLVPDITAVYHADPLMNTMLTYINTHLRDDLSLDRIARHCHISKYYMCRRFREEINMTVMQYISNQRIITAKNALIGTDKSIADVALENGYVNTSHFCSVFRRTEGISPAVFRKQYK